MQYIRFYFKGSTCHYANLLNLTTYLREGTPLKLEFSNDHGLKIVHSVNIENDLSFMQLRLPRRYFNSNQ